MFETQTLAEVRSEYFSGAAKRCLIGWGPSARLIERLLMLKTMMKENWMRGRLEIRCGGGWDLNDRRVGRRQLDSLASNRLSRPTIR